LSFHSQEVLFIAFGVASAGAFAGLWIHKLPKAARAVIPFSGGLLVGVALFGLLPELASEIGWLRGLPVFGAGYFLLMWLDRRFHGHVVSDGGMSVQGFNWDFAIPLLIAASLHAFLDGWGLESAGTGTSEAVRVTFPIAVVLHKAPEGLALGAIFLAALRSRWKSIACCLLAEAATFAGGWAGSALTPHLGSAWTNYPLALAGGCFLYLGYHAIESEWRRLGPRAAFPPAVIGFAGAAAIQTGVRWLGL